MTVRSVQVDTVDPRPWRNGGGSTRELLTWPDATDWQLRVSVAEIASDGPFSDSPGLRRWFCVVEGDGVTLGFASRAHHLDSRSPPFEFDGGDAPDCRLIHGPTRDLNMMVRRGTGRIDTVERDAAWHPAAPGAAVQGGLSCRVAGILHAAQAAPVRLQAHTLTWCDACPAGDWRFEPLMDAAGPVGWWLSFAADQSIG